MVNRSRSLVLVLRPQRWQNDASRVITSRAYSPSGTGESLATSAAGPSACGVAKSVALPPNNRRMDLGTGVAPTLVNLHLMAWKTEDAFTLAARTTIAIAVAVDSAFAGAIRRAVTAPPEFPAMGASRAVADVLQARHIASRSDGGSPSPARASSTSRRHCSRLWSKSRVALSKFASASR